jgi:hypothetical protein
MLRSSKYGILTLSLVLISAAIIAPSLLIAFNLQNIEEYLNKRKKIKRAPATSGGAGLSGAGTRPAEPEVGEIRLQALGGDGKRRQKLLDEEQGRKPANSSSGGSQD